MTAGSAEREASRHGVATAWTGILSRGCSGTRGSRRWRVRGLDSDGGRLHGHAHARAWRRNRPGRGLFGIDRTPDRCAGCQGRRARRRGCCTTALPRGRRGAEPCGRSSVLRGGDRPRPGYVLRRGRGGCRRRRAGDDPASRGTCDRCGGAGHSRPDPLDSCSHAGTDRLRRWAGSGSRPNRCRTGRLVTRRRNSARGCRGSGIGRGCRRRRGLSGKRRLRGLRRSRRRDCHLQLQPAAEAVLELVLVFLAAARTDDHELSSAQFIKKNINFHFFAVFPRYLYEISTRRSCWPRNT
jgi:hypothetical protein